LKLDPRKRICAKNGASDLKRHPFFQSVNWGLLRNRKAPFTPNIQFPEDTSNFELYEGDKDEQPFKFFSELPDRNNFSSEEQLNFQDFDYSCTNESNQPCSDHQKSQSGDSSPEPTTENDPYDELSSVNEFDVQIQATIEEYSQPPKQILNHSSPTDDKVAQTSPVFRPKAAKQKLSRKV